jgi:transketolase
MPSWDFFERQDESYRDEVLPPSVRSRISVEAGVTLGWERWVGEEGDMIGIDGRFGASAPGATVLKNLGFTAENVAQRTLALVERLSGVRT